MILTVTPNTALDRVLFLPELQRNRRNQATDALETMGGKGCNVSLVLREMGEETVATGIAAGEAGRRMEAVLRAAGVTPDFIWTQGETRVNTVLIEQANAGHTTVCTPGVRANDHDFAALRSWTERWAQAAQVVVIAGSLPGNWPADRYAELVRAAAAHAPVVVDASGACLAAAVAAGVAAVKPNRDELESVLGPLSDEPALLSGARDLQRRGAGRVLVSLGADGALLVSGRGAWRARPPAVEVVNPAGAGDGMTAYLALAETRGWDEEETLRWAVAVSAAIVGTRGTAEVRRSEVERLLEAVRVEDAC